mgnify:CR=1 FL=1
MAKKTQDFEVFIFTQNNIPIYAIEIKASKSKVKNMVDEFKYKYDLKKLTVEHMEYFINYIKTQGIDVIESRNNIEWV